ncbi:endoplasmic reticulum metallopeptidase 1-like isoform X2 [Phlebotomus argentipes]|uniref:endoplasmic reticulum metallopeptidase 1-like isoform X2 n=1 Tax=Phlebotomus argentipes TaxID=94469 RepID=UPI0028932942|nr:endoplasmic reticulum metallopeptidase 1-like isoform X2 [Phlebotomus argentipes]
MVKDSWDKFRTTVKRWYEGTNKRKVIYDVYTIPSWTAPIILAVVLGMFVAVHFLYYALPAALQQEHEPFYPHRFIAERAEMHTRNLTQFGARVGGSQANDYSAVNHLYEELERIAVRAASGVHRIELDVQKADEGAFELQFTPYGMTNVYHGVHNVIVRMTPTVPNSEYSGHCLLVNSHFDTIPSTVGGSDAAAMVGIMMELLRKLSTRAEVFRHCVVFLFNGAEENYMLGAHAFITRHKWAGAVKAFVNLDSAGAGGREIMFQAGPGHPFLVRHLQISAPRPRASAIAEELFQKGTVPSDSDFRVFRDFGRIPGMDFAFHANGYVYHTKYDTPDVIPSETYQQVGDNILALLVSLLDSYELYEVEAFSDEPAVFFDFLGWFLVVYSRYEGVVINSLTAAIGILVIAFCLKAMSFKSGLSMTEILTEFGVSVTILAISVGIGIALVLLLAVILDSAGRSMSWFAIPWFLFGLYFCPLLLAIGTGVTLYIHYFKRDLLSISHRVQLFLHSHFLLLILALIITTAMGLRSSYVLLPATLFYAVTAFINGMLFHNRRRSWLIVHLIGQLLPLLFYCQQAHLALLTLIPLTGRGGATSNPDLLVGLICTILALLLGGFLIPLVALCRHPRAVLSIFLLWMCINIILIITPLGFPFREATAPQRFWIFHTHRRIQDFNNASSWEDSGYFILSMDRHTSSSVKSFIPDLALAQPLGNACDGDLLFCGMPLLSSRKHNRASESLWMPGPAPVLPDATGLELLAETLEPGATRKTFTFAVTATAHMGIFLSPRHGMEMVQWSLLDHVPSSGPRWHDRETYFVFLNYGFNYFRRLEFNVTVQAPSIFRQGIQSIDIAIVSHYLFHEDFRTPEFNELLDKFPSWAYAQGTQSSYESFIF